MKKSKHTISDWLDKYGDPKIDKQVEKELEEIIAKHQREMKKISTSKRLSAFALLNEFCTLSVGSRKDKGDFLEVTEWSNGEGYDIHISDVEGEKTFRLTWGQYDALKKCIKTIEKEHFITKEK